MNGPCLCGDPYCPRCFVQPDRCPLCGDYTELDYRCEDYGCYYYDSSDFTLQDIAVPDHAHCECDPIAKAAKWKAIDDYDYEQSLKYQELKYDYYD